MKIPKYVIELMERSRYEYDFCTKDPNYAVGYTLSIRKGSEYQQVDTLRKEMERLCSWANRAAGVETAFLLHVPKKTHYTKQAAIVTIFDPVMQKIEQYIPERKGR